MDFDERIKRLAAEDAGHAERVSCEAEWKELQQRQAKLLADATSEMTLRFPDLLCRKCNLDDLAGPFIGYGECLFALDSDFWLHGDDADESEWGLVAGLILESRFAANEPHIKQALRRIQEANLVRRFIVAFGKIGERLQSRLEYRPPLPLMNQVELAELISSTITQLRRQIKSGYWWNGEQWFYNPPLNRRPKAQQRPQKRMWFHISTHRQHEYLQRFRDSHSFGPKITELMNQELAAEKEKMADFLRKWPPIIQKWPMDLKNGLPNENTQARL